MAKTTNYNLLKASLGHSVRDVDIGTNLDLIDTAIKAREDSIDALKLQKGIVTAELSFEAYRQTATKIYFPDTVAITRIRGIVTKEIEDTDDGTITGANNIGNSANGVLTAILGDGLNHQYLTDPTSNNAICADSFYTLTSSKPTPGGIVLVTLEYTRNVATMWFMKAPTLGAETRIYSLAVLNDKIYGGTDPNGKLYEWNGVDAWAEKAPKLGAETLIYSLAVLNGKIYGGTFPNGKLYEGFI
jgi:hypothetical protein